MTMTINDKIDFLLAIGNDENLLEAARKKIEEALIEFRNARISNQRNNGLVIKEYDGSDSHIIRMGPEDAMRIGLMAIIEEMKK
ncbi:MAG: hypothetical protein Q8O83_02175 [bacterium]|nr:hypothetical protein [bacterium]